MNHKSKHEIISGSQCRMYPCNSGLAQSGTDRLVVDVKSVEDVLGVLVYIDVI